jgi:hypothetical protein
MREYNITLVPKSKTVRELAREVLNSQITALKGEIRISKQIMAFQKRKISEKEFQIKELEEIISGQTDLFSKKEGEKDA